MMILIIASHQNKHESQAKNRKKKTLQNNVPFPKQSYFKRQKKSLNLHFILIEI